jgi:predicted GIY-YIG superfamily endonuclease
MEESVFDVKMMTGNLSQRVAQHFGGNGSVVTKQNSVKSFSHIYQHASKSAAKAAEYDLDLWQAFAGRSAEGLGDIRWPA